MSSTVPIVQPQPGHKPSRAPREAHVGPSDVSAKRQYLVLYNLVSLLLWAALILRAAATILFTTGRSLTLSGASKPFTTSVANIYPSSGDFAKWVQTVALAEVVHSLVGLVRAPVLTTAMQVASRFLLVWGIVHPFGQNMLTGTAGFESESTRRNQQAYLGMLIAWSVTECIRYSYFVFFLGSGKVPDLLSWLRYNTFFVLYPLGISCECYLVYKAIPYAKQLDANYAYFLYAVLAIYVPGSYILYSHMMTQRRRILKGKQKQGNA